jgi:EAL domain-containing protein (putative c-di-GMP-specific phosphodiesterase class I)
MTSVEWLVEHLTEYGFDLSHHELEIQQAKEMERQEKIKAQIEILRECGYDERDAILNRLLNQLAK